MVTWKPISIEAIKVFLTSLNQLWEKRREKKKEEVYREMKLENPCAFWSLVLPFPKNMMSIVGASLVWSIDVEQIMIFFGKINCQNEII